MAEKENIKDRIRRTNPGGLIVADTLDQVLKEMGQNPVIVQTTEDMTIEEEEMALFEGFLKEGYPIEEASKKAKDLFHLMHSLF